MKNKFFACVIALTSASINTYSQSAPTKIESNKIVIMFEQELPKFIKVVKKNNFNKFVKNTHSTGVTEKERIITYILGKNVIRYYESEGDRILLFLKLYDMSIFANDIKFVSLDKAHIIPSNKLKSNNFFIESTGGAEEIKLKFDKEKIIYLEYKATPD